MLVRCMGLFCIGFFGINRKTFEPLTHTLMKYFTCIVLVAVAYWGQGQTTGDYYMTHYSPQAENQDFWIFDMVTDQNGLLWVSTNYGVYSYDGRDWDFYSTPTAAVSLAVTDSNRLYVGGVAEVGRLDYRKQEFGYQRLYENDSLGDIFLQATADQERVYFASGKSLITCENGEVMSKTGDFVSLYQTYGKTFVNTLDSTFVLDPQPTAASQHDEIAFAFGKNQREAFFTNDKELLINGVKVLHNDLLLRMGFLPSDGAFINDTLFVLSSLDQGAIFLSTKDTSYHKVVDYYSGLPDNEIYALHVDEENGVWMAHQFGLTRVLPLFPATTYSNLPGLRGNLISVEELDQDLWVLTSLGIYFYNRDTTFKTKVYYEAKKPPKRVTKKETTPEPAEEEGSGFLGGLFGKRDRANSQKKGKPVKGFFKQLNQELEDIFAAGGEIEKIVGKKNSKIEYIRKEEIIPVKVSNEFKEIPGARGKFTNLFKYKNKLIAAANSGLYEVSRESATQVVDESIKKVVHTNSNQILIYTYSEELALFEVLDDVWYELWRQPLQHALLDIYCSADNHLWLLGSRKLYKTSISDSTMQVSNTYSVSNEQLEQFKMLESNDRLWYISRDGLFYYDSVEDTFKKDTEKEDIVSRVDKTVVDEQGNVWIYDGMKWFEFTKEEKLAEFEYLSIFPDIKFISHNGSGRSYWIITDNNTLFSYDIDRAVELDAKSNLFVKKVRSRERDYESDSEFTLSYDENYLSVNISNPDFTGLLKPQYQYRLAGLNNEWSDWTKNNIIDYSYLPPGSYTLEVKARDNLGRGNAYKLLSFKVETPYWQQPWFYALQVVFFMSLIVLSSRLNQSKGSSRLLSAGLTVFTIVLFIEFLQSVIGSYINIKSSPVIDFGVDATIALLIFPLERFLRAFIKAGGNIFRLRSVMMQSS